MTSHDVISFTTKTDFICDFNGFIHNLTERKKGGLWFILSVQNVFVCEKSNIWKFGRIAITNATHATTLKNMSNDSLERKSLQINWLLGDSFFLIEWRHRESLPSMFSLWKWEFRALTLKCDYFCAMAHKKWSHQHHWKRNFADKKSLIWV